MVCISQGAISSWNVACWPPSFEASFCTTPHMTFSNNRSLGRQVFLLGVRAQRRVARRPAHIASFSVNTEHRKWNFKSKGRTCKPRVCGCCSVRCSTKSWSMDRKALLEGTACPPACMKRLQSAYLAASITLHLAGTQLSWRPKTFKVRI